MDKGCDSRYEGPGVCDASSYISHIIMYVLVCEHAIARLVWGLRNKKDGLDLVFFDCIVADARLKRPKK